MKEWWWWAVVVLLVLCHTPTHVTTTNTTHDDGRCCSLAPPPCRDTCYQIPLWVLALEDRRKGEHWTSLTGSCPPSLTEYWSCLSNTLKGVSEGAGWWGRPCCRLALSSACQVTCLRASKPPQLSPVCRPSHEMDFFACVTKTEAGVACCARTQSYRCRSSCESLFAARTPTRPLRRQLARDCRLHPHVTHCAHTLTRTTPAHRPERNLHCCAASSSVTCRSACRRGLTSGQAQQDILDHLEGACGSVNLSSGLWQCLFKQSEAAGASHPVQSVDVSDAGRAGCCGLAVSRACGELCWRAYSRAWGGQAFDALHANCLIRPGEARLVACLGEAEAPCRMGCSGLSFCSAMTGPTRLFRSCTVRADAAAQQDLQLWQDSLRLRLPGLAATLPLVSITQCLPEVWRAAVCALHLRPCHSTSLTSALCWHDCLSLLARCVVESEGGLTVGQVCSELSPPHGSPCVSLAPFLVPPPSTPEPPWRTPTSPCRSDPCPPHHMCRVSPDCPPGAPCQPYTCTPSCVLGEASTVPVPRGAFLMLPPRDGSVGCGRVCECGRGGVVGECKAAPCLQPVSCWLGTSNFQHNTEMRLGCELCVCHAGEITCLPHTCSPSQVLFAAASHPYPGVQVVPKSYLGSRFGERVNKVVESGPHPHLASWTSTTPPPPPPRGVSHPYNNRYLHHLRCAGLREGEWREGECDGGGGGGGCDGIRCGWGEVCVPLSSTCLTLPSTPCPQHICVPSEGECRGVGAEAVCGRGGVQYPSLCRMVRDGNNLHYLGKCRTDCSSVGVVCGRDGRTWASECHARAHRVTVDHLGSCRGVGVPGGTSCSNVTCPTPHKDTDSCVGVFESGWCCGRVCGGGLRVAWSTRAVEVAAVALNYHNTPTHTHTTKPLTLNTLLDALAAEVQVSECQVSGHITLQGHVLVLVTPIPVPTPPLIFEACVLEAERLVGAISVRSPRLMSTLPASTLTLAVPAHTSEGFVVKCSMLLVLVSLLVSWLWV